MARICLRLAWSRPLALTLSVAPLILAGCAMAPLSFIYDQQLYDGALSPNFPITVVAIDGSFYGPKSQMRPIQVAPGVHSITLGPTGTSMTILYQQNYAFKVDPCTRYYIAGHYQGPNAADWTLAVEKIEPVADCNPAEERKKTGLIDFSPAQIPAQAALSVTLR